MAKFLLVCARDGATVPDARIRRACELIAPDNVVPAPPQVSTAPGIALAIVTPAPSLLVHETSLCLGQILAPPADWWVPRANVPEGAFALVRTDASTVELATDAVASRSVFWVKTDTLFVASTSQRAIVAVLGSFDPDPVTVSWVLSSGALGPGRSWDARIRRMGADARVVLDRATWTATATSRDIAFEAVKLTQSEHLARLRDAVVSSCDGIELSRGEWRLPLSGGYDSRYLLLRLAPRHRLSTITWGVPAAQQDPENDAAVARVLAERVGVPHEFHAIESSRESFDVLLARFLRNGEGGADHISAYMDGFEVWRHLHDTGVSGIVRGDEAFGWVPVTLEATVRPCVGATLLGDYYTSRQIERWGLAPQSWPAELQRRGGESLATWRDRLYQAYRIPVVLASLTDLKVPYVEIVNPLVSRRILEVVRTVPDELRTDKVLFRKLVEATSPPVPFARRSAIPSYRALIGSGSFLEVARREVAAGREEGSLPAPFAEFLLGRIPRNAAVRSTPPRQSGVAWLRSKASATVRNLVPPYVRSAIRAVRPHQAIDQLAFRATVIAKMSRMLKDEAAGARALTE